MLSLLLNRRALKKVENRDEELVFEILQIVL